MAVGISNAPEPSSRKNALLGRSVLLNQELGPSCKMTKVCGETCYLHWSHSSAGRALSALELCQAGASAMGTNLSGSVRHWGLAAKEPLDYPDSVRLLTRAWHEAPPHSRPGTLGLITASANGLRSQCESWKPSPLSWILASVDPQETSLHPAKYGAALMEAVIRAKDSGGVETVGINTTITNSECSNIFAIGARAARLGIDQWSVSSLYAPRRGKLETSMTLDEVKAVAEFLAIECARFPLDVTLSVTPQQFTEMNSDWSLLREQYGKWRFERNLSANVNIIAPNPLPGYFMRVRWDGEILNHDDLLIVGLRSGSYGSIHRHSVTEVLDRLSELRLLRVHDRLLN